MALSVAEKNRIDLSPLDYTFDLLTGLSDPELQAIQTVAIAFLNNRALTELPENISSIAPFQPQTEESLFKRIDHSLSQIESGEYSDAEDVENELLMGIEE